MYFTKAMNVQGPWDSNEDWRKRGQFKMQSLMKIKIYYDLHELLEPVVCCLPKLFVCWCCGGLGRFGGVGVFGGVFCLFVFWFWVFLLWPKI